MDNDFETELKPVISMMKIGEWKRIYGRGPLAMYVTPCAGGCGKPMLSWTIRPSTVFKCSECRKTESAAATELKEHIASLTKQRRISDAKDAILKLYGETNEYDAAFKAIERAINKPVWFQSCAEVLAAAELIRTKTKAQPQVKIGKWRVDYVLPNLKVLLEVDGGFHDDPRKIEKEKIRDATILKMVGPGWIIVRVPELTIRNELRSLIPMVLERTYKRRNRRHCG